MRGNGFESEIDTVQDFLIKMGIKPCLHIFIENKHFFTKSCHRQTKQHYEKKLTKNIRPTDILQIYTAF